MVQVPVELSEYWPAVQFRRQERVTLLAKYLGGPVGQGFTQVRVVGSAKKLAEQTARHLPVVESAYVLAPLGQSQF